MMKVHNQNNKFLKRKIDMSCILGSYQAFKGIGVN